MQNQPADFRKTAFGRETEAVSAVRKKRHFLFRPAEGIPHGFGKGPSEQSVLYNPMDYLGSRGSNDPGSWCRRNIQVLHRFRPIQYRSDFGERNREVLSESLYSTVAVIIQPYPSTICSDNDATFHISTDQKLPVAGEVLRRRGVLSSVTIQYALSWEAVLFQFNTEFKSWSCIIKVQSLNILKDGKIPSGRW